MARITCLEVRNFKAIKAIKYNPDPALNCIGGNNGQGKSSFIDSIAALFGGAKLCPEQPIREGQTSATLHAKLDDGLQATRTFSLNRPSKLVVTEQGGVKVKGGPQAKLDKYIGELSFDPTEFLNMSPLQRRATLSAVAGLDTSDLDDRREKLFAKRTDINRETNRLKTVVGTFMQYDDAPDEPVDTSALAQELNRRREHNRAVATHKRTLQDAAMDHEKSHAAVERLTMELREAKQQSVRQWELVRDAALVCESDEAMDEQETIDAMAGASEQNRKHQAEAGRMNAIRQTTQSMLEALSLTDNIAEVDAERVARVAAAQFPLKGLSVSEDGVAFEGIPFEQISSAQQLRASVAIALSLNHELRVMYIKHGSLLDDKSLALLAELAEEYDAQLWVERVGHGEENQLIIEDGEAVE